MAKSLPWRLWYQTIARLWNGRRLGATTLTNPIVATTRMVREDGRRGFQRAYVDAVSTRGPEDHQTIVESVLPQFEGMVVPVRMRRTARKWVDELLDRGILVREPDPAHPEREIFRLNPHNGGQTASAELVRLLAAPAPDLTRLQHGELTIHLVVDAILFYALYVSFIPQVVWAQVGSVTAVLTGALAFVGWKATPEATPVDILWSRRTLIAARIATTVFVVASITRVVFPFEVLAPPGATVRGDTKELAIGEQSANERGALHIPGVFGAHKLVVSRRWYVDATTGEPASRLSLSWPGDRRAESKMISYVEIAQDSTVARSPGDDPGVTDSLKRRLGSLLLVAQECLIAAETPELVVCQGGSPKPGVVFSAQVEQRTVSGHRRMIVMCGAPSDQRVRRLGYCDIKPGDNWNAERDLFRACLERELGVTSHQFETQWDAEDAAVTSVLQHRDGALRALAAVVDTGGLSEPALQRATELVVATLGGITNRPGLRTLVKQQVHSSFGTYVANVSDVAKTAKPETFGASVNAMVQIQGAAAAVGDSSLASRALNALNDAKTVAKDRFGAPTVASLAECGAVGVAGRLDSLNLAKNRTDVPRKPQLRSVEAISRLNVDPEWASRRHELGQGSRAEIRAAGEGTPVQVEAYLVMAHISGPESCNCYLVGIANSDFHLELAGTPNASPGERLIAEVTPRLRPAGWEIGRFSDLAASNARVRVSGWLMLDTEHLKDAGNRRASAWEIHPVTGIETWSGGRWIALQDLPPLRTPAYTAAR